MKKHLLLFTLFALLLTLTTNAQFRRIVLLEEATNASCGPCAANNPNLQKFFEANFGGIISVRYHAWWPGSDPMYNENTSENRTRINYYGINGVPGYTVDGEFKGLPGDIGAMTSQMNSRLALGSPIKVEVTSEVTSSHINATVTIIGGANVSQSNLKLRTAVIERMKIYSSAPGSNGEKEFPDVFRKMMPDAQGESISSINNGDTLTYEYSIPLESAWNKDDLAIVAWVQSDATKEVINAGTCLSTYIIESPEEDAAFVNYNQTITKSMVVVNENKETLNLKIYPTSTTIPEGWAYELLENGTATDTISASLAPGDSAEFTLSLMTGEEGRYAVVNIKAENTDNIYGYGFTSSYFGTVKQGTVLFVDADGGSSYESRYYAAFDSAQIDYTVALNSNVRNLFSVESPNYYNAIFWNVSWAFPAMDDATAEFLMNYLDNGGQLFIAGQDIGWDIYEGDAGSQTIKMFYEQYLDADYLADNSSKYTVEGVAGDPIGDGLSFSIGSPYSRYPEVIGSQSGDGVLFLQYTDTEKYGAIRYDNGTFKTVYSGIGLEQISQSDMRALYIKNILSWFGIITDVDDENNDALAFDYSLSQNYPNPFNPATVINYSVKNTAKVELKVYDVLGAEVATLVNEVKAAGSYSVDFNASNLSTGVYFYRLTSGDFVSIKKMLLIK